MNIKKCTHQHALTIIELLITIAILAILAALIFPAIRGLNDRMNAVNCMANLRVFGTAVLTWRAEHDGYLPPGPPLLSPVSLSANNNPMDGVDIKKDLIKGGYLSENNLPYCPAMRLSETGLKNLKPGQTPQSIFKQNGSYVLNLFLAQTKIEGLPGPYWGGFPYPGDSKMLLAAEAYFCGLSNSIDHQNFTLKGLDFGMSYNHAPRSHGNNRLNFMFLDGHIALLAPKVTEDGTTVWQVKNNNDLNDPAIPFDSWGRNGKYVQQRNAMIP